MSDELSVDFSSIVAAVERLWAKVPEVKCKGRCQDCCGPIGMSEAEAMIMEQHVGCRVSFDRIEGGKVLVGNFDRKTLKCPLLNPDGRCAAYAVRPLICRIWGALKKMRCQHGCRPKRWLDEDESYRLLGAAERLTTLHAEPIAIELASALRAAGRSIFKNTTWESKPLE